MDRRLSSLRSLRRLFGGSRGNRNFWPQNGSGLDEFGKTGVWHVGVPELLGKQFPSHSRPLDFCTAKFRAPLICSWFFSHHLVANLCGQCPFRVMFKVKNRESCSWPLPWPGTSSFPGCHVCHLPHAAFPHLSARNRTRGQDPHFRPYVREGL